MISSFSGEHRFLSNFWSVDVLFEDVVYPSIEHAYVAAKTTNFETRRQILACDSPGKVKRFGRTIKIRNNWDDIKLLVMESLLRTKFKEGYLMKMLIDTGTEELIEGNTWGDTFWGVCDGVGENHLGRLLMMIREELIQEQNNESN